MNRVYFDSNVFQLLKLSHPGHKTDLLTVVNALKDKFVLCFSDAHLDDLKRSQKHYRDQDLSFMEQYVNYNYYAYEHVNKPGFRHYLSTPKEAFDRRNYEAAEKIVANPFDLKLLIEGLDDMPEMQPLVTLFDTVMNMPISALGPTVDVSAMDETNKYWMDKVFPGYSSDMSIKDMMTSITPFGIGMLEDEKKVTELRRHISDYMDSNDYSFAKWGMGFNEAFRNTALGKTFLEVIDNMLLDSQKNNIYLRFSYAYSLLEMYNVTQERKSRGGLKKFNYESLTTDALHAYFASFCDYLITDDKGLQVKAHIMYELLGFSTKVLSTQDFINSKTLLTGQEETFNSFLDSLVYDLEKSFQIGQKQDISNGTSIKTYKTSHHYFNYFNRLNRISGSGNITLVLYCERSGEGNFIMSSEVELLVKKTISVLGIDDANKGFYDPKIEGNKLNDYIRRWTFPENVVTLERSQIIEGKNSLQLQIKLEK
jgi:hypothetical protein